MSHDPGYFINKFTRSTSYCITMCTSRLYNRHVPEYVASIHQDNMSVCFIPPYTQLLYSKIGVNRGIHYFHFFALKHRLWVLVRTNLS